MIERHCTYIPAAHTPIAFPAVFRHYRSYQKHRETAYSTRAECKEGSWKPPSMPAPTSGRLLAAGESAVPAPALTCGTSLVAFATAVQFPAPDPVPVPACVSGRLPAAVVSAARFVAPE